MSDAKPTEQSKGQDFTSETAAGNFFSQASTTGSEVTKHNFSKGSQVRRKLPARKNRKNTGNKLKLHKIHERNSIQEDDERTEIGDNESTIQNDALPNDSP
jgi:hypothetical protein